MENIDIDITGEKRKITTEEIDICVKTIVGINIKNDISLKEQYKIIKAYINSLENDDKKNIINELKDKHILYLVDSVIKGGDESLKTRWVSVLKSV